MSKSNSKSSKPRSTISYNSLQQDRSRLAFSQDKQRPNSQFRHQSVIPQSVLRQENVGNAGPWQNFCSEHSYPLTCMCKTCGEVFICEVCGVEEHAQHETMALRPFIVELMNRFEDNFINF